MRPRILILSVNLVGSIRVCETIFTLLQGVEQIKFQQDSAKKKERSLARKQTTSSWTLLFQVLARPAQPLYHHPDFASISDLSSWIFVLFAFHLPSIPILSEPFTCLPFQSCLRVMGFDKRKASIDLLNFSSKPQDSVVFPQARNSCGHSGPVNTIVLLACLTHTTITT